MRALVTGGAGFIGSNLVAYLLDNNWSVRVLDNLSSGFEKNLYGKDVELIIGDICNIEITTKACQNIDVVFHLAASVGNQRSLDNPVLDSNTNLIGTVNVLEGMIKHSVKKIVYSSSAAIFGELHMTSIDENHSQNPDSPYGVSKLSAEKMILAYSRIYNITGICLRYFNIYGINQRYDFYGNVIPIFMKQILTGDSLTIYGDGEQTRDFVNVKDIAKANFLAATSNNKTSVYNLGSGQSISINELSSLIQRICQKKIKVVYAPERIADVRHCKASTRKALDELDFKSSVGLYEGLNEYKLWFENNQ